MEATIKTNDGGIKNFKAWIDEQLAIAAEANATVETYKIRLAKAEEERAEHQRKLEEIKVEEVPKIAAATTTNFDADLFAKILLMPGEEGAVAFKNLQQQAAKEHAERNVNLEEADLYGIQNAANSSANDGIILGPTLDGTFDAELPEFDEDVFDSDMDDDEEPAPDASAPPEEWKIWGAKAAAKKQANKERKEAKSKKRKNILQSCKEYAGTQQKGGKVRQVAKH